jgi:hypothetical protein
MEGYYSDANNEINIVCETTSTIVIAKTNTEIFVLTMEESAYFNDWGSKKEGYAAKACDDFSIVVDTETWERWVYPIERRSKQNVSKFRKFKN